MWLCKYIVTPATPTRCAYLCIGMRNYSARGMHEEIDARGSGKDLMLVYGPVNFVQHLDDHYIDVIMTTTASQITSLTVVYSIVYSGADQRKHQSSASLAFVWGIHRSRWIPRTKEQLRGKCFHLMTSSCYEDMWMYNHSHVQKWIDLVIW